MALITLNRINKGGEILINTEHIVFVEVEAKTTTVHLRGELFAVEESLPVIVARLEEIETARIRNAIQQSGLVASAPV